MKGEKLNLTEKELNNIRNYHVQSQSNSFHPKPNAISISDGSTIRHELAKCIAAIQAHKYGDVKFTSKLLFLINEIENEIREMALIEQPSAFITEAVINDSKPERRVDLVILRSNTKVEIETQKFIKKDDCLTIYV